MSRSAALRRNRRVVSMIGFPAGASANFSRCGRRLLMGAGRWYLSGAGYWFAGSRKRKLHARLRQTSPTGKSLRIIGNAVKPLAEKYSCCPVGQIRIKTPAILSRRKGRWPSSRTWGRERWTRGGERRARHLRTAKSFGSDAPVLASRRDEAIASHGDGGNKAGHQDEIV